MKICISNASCLLTTWYPKSCHLLQIQLNTVFRKNHVQALWYFTSLAKYVVINNSIYQSIPPLLPLSFQNQRSRDVHLIKEKSQSALEGPNGNLLMSSRCLATDTLMLAPWKIFPGVCSFMHCCTTGIRKLFLWGKIIVNQRQAGNKTT